MVKKSLIFAFIFLFSVAAIQASSLTRLDSLRVFAMWQAGRSASGDNQITTAKANMYINVGIYKITSNFPATVKRRTISMSKHVDTYLIDTLFDSLLYCIHKDGITGVRKPLRKIPNDFDWEWIVNEKTLPQDTIKTTNSPQYVMVSGDSLTVIPAPTVNDYLEVSYAAIGRKLTSDTMTTDVRPKYRELIGIYAAYLMCLDLELFNRADILKAEYDAAYNRELRIVKL